MIENINEIPTDHLIEIYKNAYYTRCMCGGHTKAHRNKMIADEALTELERRGEEKPTEQGTFNGVGSW
tara:strand:+ start:67 stop:270 length:204 start_codon:yes stop_codon:yes gene_type:complete